MIITILISLLSSYFVFIKGFNLDPSKAFIFKGPKDSYFGFSLSLHSNSHGDWLLVGAPKANSSYQDDLESPGALYKCPFSYGAQCSQVNVDDKGNEATTLFVQQGNVKIRLRFTDRKEQQWLGVSLDAHQGDVVVCAHRWADTRYRDHIFGNGQCYELNGELEFNSTKRHLALTKRGLQIRMGEPNEYLYAFGQQGISSHYTEDGKALLVGAPGIRDWAGGVVAYTTGIGYVGKPGYSVPKNSYIGYAVASGRFYDHETTYYVAGGPKADLVGKVFIYKGPFDVRAELSGRQFGEYFGAALCVVDINQDGFDDLLVGAPHHKAKGHEEGRVAVYTMQHTHVFEHQMDLVGSLEKRARFGSALTSGDLNLDGHPDVIVGAPYESDHGAIYIYNGHKKGLHSRYSQRIGGEEVGLGLKGFGFSLSKPKSRNGEYFPVIPVGSYASDQALLIPTRPVVNIKMAALTEPALINPRVANCRHGSEHRTCLALKVTLEYDGVLLPPGLSFKGNVRTDITRKTGSQHELPVRANFRNTTHENDLALTPEVSFMVHDLPANQPSVTYFLLILNRHVRDIITPLSVSVDLKLIKDERNNTELAPVLHVYRPHKIVLPIPFDKYCGVDNRCVTDLQLSTSVQWPTPHHYIILGQEQSFNIQINVKNMGEKAYLSTLTINFPPELQYVGLRKNSNDDGGTQLACTLYADEDFILENDFAELACEIGNPIYENGHKNLTIVFHRQLSYHADDYLKDKINVNIWTTTRSNETKLDNNNVTLCLPIKIVAAMNISGVSNPEQQIYDLKDPSLNETQSGNETTDTLGIAEVTHIYDLRNDGPGLFPGGHIVILIPEYSADGLLLAESFVELSRENEDDELTYTSEDRKRRGVQQAPLSNLESGDDKLEQPSAEALFGRRGPGPLILDCKTLQCKPLRFYIGPLNDGQGAVITIKLYLHMDNLTALEGSGALAFSSEVRLLPNHWDRQNTEVSLKVVTLVMPRRVALSDIHIPWWVLAASIGVGVILLMVVILILYKFGFFKRHERDELAKLIGQNEANEENENRMLESTDEWQGYDPWQPQSPDTNLLIWHANGSISHNSHADYLAATQRLSSSSSYDRNLNEKCRNGKQPILNGGTKSNFSNFNGRVRSPNDCVPPPPPPPLPTPRDPRGQLEVRHFDSYYRRDSLGEDAGTILGRRPPSESHSYLVIRPDDSDEDVFLHEDNTEQNYSHIDR